MAILTPQQALDRLQQAAGRALTPAEIEQAKGMLPAGWEQGIDDAALAPLLSKAGTLNTTARPDATWPGTPTTTVTPPWVSAGTPGSFNDPAARIPLGVAPGPGQITPTTPGGAGNPTGGAPPPGGNTTPLGTLLDPYTKTPPGTVGYNPPAPPQFQGPSFNPTAPRVAPGPFEYQPFDPGAQFSFDPKAVLDDPSYKFRLGEGEQALQQSAAAGGLLRSGGTLKDILKYGQNFASNEVQNVFGRDLNTYQSNLGNKFNAWQANRGNALGNYMTNYDIGKDVNDVNYGRSLDAFNTGLTSAQAAYNPQLLGWQTDVSQGRQNVDNFNNTAYKNWQNEYDIWDAHRKFVEQTLRNQQELGLRGAGA